MSPGWTVVLLILALGRDALAYHSYYNPFTIIPLQSILLFLAHILPGSPQLPF
jgi:hypothetical protein